MKYYAVSDVHGFYSKMCEALKAAGYYDDKTPHKLIICGDCFDRGGEALQMQSFLLDHIGDPDVILIKGNHEDLFEDFLLRDHGGFLNHHISNGTVGTALQLTSYDVGMAQAARNDFVQACLNTPYYRTIIPTMKNYYETDNYIFVHGYIPCYTPSDWCFRAMANWRTASEEEWKAARWYNGMRAARTVKTGKTVVCGHWHTSFGHAILDGNGTEFGDDAVFSPYYGDGVIAIDGCTAHSGMVNVLVVED